MVKFRAYLIDIDGTLANGEHRQHYVKNKPKNWDAYNAAMYKDLPIMAVIDTVRLLHSCGIKIILCSGRQDKDKKATEEWLILNNVPYDLIFMRKTKDYRDDTVIKREIYENEIKPNFEVIAVFDDRKKVKKMWVEQGLHVFDCNNHDIEF